LEAQDPQGGTNLGFPEVKPDASRPAGLQNGFTQGATLKRASQIALNQSARGALPAASQGDVATISSQAQKFVIANQDKVNSSGNKSRWQDEFNARIDYAREVKPDDKVELFYLPGTQKIGQGKATVLAGEFYIVVIPKKNPNDWFIQNYIPAVTGGPKSPNKDGTATPTPAGSFPIRETKGSYTTNRWLDAVIPYGATFSEGKSGDLAYTDPRDNKPRSVRAAYLEHFGQRLPLHPDYQGKWKHMSPAQRAEAIKSQTELQIDRFRKDYCSKGKPYTGNPFGSVAVTLGGRAGEMGVMIHDVANGNVAKDNDPGSHGCIHLPDLAVPEVRKLVARAAEIHISSYAPKPAEGQDYAKTMGFLYSKLGSSPKS
jgi:hypothetical protein